MQNPNDKIKMLLGSLMWDATMLQSSLEAASLRIQELEDEMAYTQEKIEDDE